MGLWTTIIHRSDLSRANSVLSSPEDSYPITHFSGAWGQLRSNWNFPYAAGIQNQLSFGFAVLKSAWETGNSHSTAKCWSLPDPTQYLFLDMRHRLNKNSQKSPITEVWTNSSFPYAQKTHPTWPCCWTPHVSVMTHNVCTWKCKDLSGTKNPLQTGTFAYSHMHSSCLHNIYFSVHFIFFPFPQKSSSCHIYLILWKKFWLESTVSVALHACLSLQLSLFFLHTVKVTNLHY